jgi:hypothetical protein
MADSVQYKSLPEVLYCKTCNYYTCNKKQIEKHFLSSKHIKNISISAELPPLPPPTAEEPATIEDELQSDSDIPAAPPNTPTPLICECCGKIYKRKRALLRHQQSKQQEQEQQEQTQTDTNSSLTEQEKDNQSLELISDGESSNVEFEYITIDPLIIDPLIVNNDVMYFLQAFMYSVDVVMGISVFINKIFSFFSLTSNNDSD